jgi:hypothetical protein
MREAERAAELLKKAMRSVKYRGEDDALGW